jgi:hypothetical protein
MSQLGRLEAEGLDGVEQPAGAGNDAVAPAVGQAAGEDLEDAAPVGRAAAQGGLQHGQLVVVREQRGGRDRDGQAQVCCAHGK